MPLPSRRADEDKQSFIKRCMGDEVMKREFPDQKQRAAVCHDQLSDLELPQTIQLEERQLVQLEERDEDGRRPFLMLGYTGARVNLGFIDAVFDLQGMEVAEKTVIFRQHDPNRIVGMAKAEVGENVTLLGEFFDTPDSQSVQNLGDQGFPWQASVGLRALEAELVLEDEEVEVNGRAEKGPFVHVKRSKLKESSFVPLGADENTFAVALSDQDGVLTLRRHSKKGEVMQENEQATPQAQTSPEGPDPVQLERQRVTDILAAFPDDPEYASEQVQAGVSLLEAKAGYVDRLRDKMSRRPAPPPVPAMVGEQGSVQASGDPVAQWHDAVHVKLSAGLSDWEARRQVAVEQPELHRAYLEEYNRRTPRRGA